MQIHTPMQMYIPYTVDNRFYEHLFYEQIDVMNRFEIPVLTLIDLMFKKNLFYSHQFYEQIDSMNEFYRSCTFINISII